MENEITYLINFRSNMPRLKIYQYIYLNEPAMIGDIIKINKKLFSNISPKRFKKIYIDCFRFKVVERVFNCQSNYSSNIEGNENYYDCELKLELLDVDYLKRIDEGLGLKTEYKNKK